MLQHEAHIGEARERPLEGARWRRVTAALRRDGPRAIGFKALHRAGFRYVLLLELEFDRALSASSDVAAEVRQLCPQDLSAYLRARPECSEQDLRERLAMGHLCFVTWTGGRISSTVWLRQDRVWLPEVDRAVLLGPGSLFAYDSWTCPDLRGHNIAAARGDEIFRALRTAGYARMVGYASPEKHAGRRTLEKVGFERVAVVGFFQVGPLRLEYTRRGARFGCRLRRAPRSLHSEPLWRDPLGWREPVREQTP